MQSRNVHLKKKKKDSKETIWKAFQVIVFIFRNVIFFSSFMINNQKKKTFKKVKNSVLSGGPFNHKAV